MSSNVIRSASARQSQIANRAQQMGVDEAYIGILVDHFYSKVRRDHELGAVFEAAIGDCWSDHLTTMKQFWASVALDARTYVGRPIPAHHKHRDRIKPEHFQLWLALFEQALEETAPSVEAAAFFSDRARRMAHSFQSILFK